MTSSTTCLLVLYRCYTNSDCQFQTQAVLIRTMSQLPNKYMGSLPHPLNM